MCREDTTIVISFLYVFSGFELIGLLYNTFASTNMIHYNTWLPV